MKILMHDFTSITVIKNKQKLEISEMPNFALHSYWFFFFLPSNDYVSSVYNKHNYGYYDSLKKMNHKRYETQNRNS